MPITVRGPDGVDLKIPRWMTDPSAGDLVLSDTATLAVAALRAVTELVATHERLTLSAAGIPEHPRSQTTSECERIHDSQVSVARRDCRESQDRR